MPSEVSRIAKKYMKNPKELEVGKRNQGAENIEHVYYVVQSRDRYLALKRIVDYYPEIFGIVFCRTKAETQEVADSLIKDGYSADALHGDLSQAQRDFVMKRFRSRTLQMLVATDVAARGIDINDITHVINYNLPEDAEIYTHRSGRTARAGKTGKSIAIVSVKEVGRIREVEKVIAKKFVQQPIPNGVEVCEKQLFHLVHKLHKVEVNEVEIESYLPKIYDELKDLSKEEIIKRFVSEEFNRFLEYYQNTSDLNVSGKGNGYGDSRTIRFFANVGLMDGLNRQSLKDFLAEQVNLNPRMIFNVDVKNSFSFFETETGMKDKFMALNEAGINFNTRTLQLEISEKRKSGRGGEGSGGGGRSFDRKGKFDKKPFFGKGNSGSARPEKRRSKDSDYSSKSFSGSKGGRKEKFGRRD
jgi:ATP-dependent RNA helicase DeaD